MRSSLQAIILSSNEQVSSQLRNRFIDAGVQCGSPIASLDNIDVTLGSTSPPPDLIFVHCEGMHGRDSGLISRLSETTATPIVAVGEASDSLHILRLIRSGAADFLHTAGHFDEELRAILARVKNHIHRQSNAGSITSIVSVSGGCGSSSVALNLSASLALRSITPCLVDLRMCGGDLAVMLNLTPKHTISDLCHQSQQLDPEMLRKALVEHSSGLRLLAAPPPLKDCGPVDHEAVRQVMRMLQGMFPQVIVDLDDVFHREQLSTIQDSTSLLIVLRLEFPCLVRCRRMLEYLELQGISRERIQLVANRQCSKHKLPRKQVIEALGQPIRYFLPEDSGISAMCLNVGNPVVCEAQSSALATAYLSMSKDLVTK